MKAIRKYTDQGVAGTGRTRERCFVRLAWEVGVVAKSPRAVGMSWLWRAVWLAELAVPPFESHGLSRGHTDPQFAFGGPASYISLRRKRKSRRELSSFPLHGIRGKDSSIRKSAKFLSHVLSLSSVYIHIHTYVIVFRFHGDLYTWQAEHRRGSKARERRACSTREEIYFVYSIVWIGWFREFDSRPCWSPRTLERIETGVLPM